MKKRTFYTLFALLGIILAGCGSGETSTGEKTEVKIGYFPNLTHVATIVALEKGFFAEAFGEDIEINAQTFNNGGVFMEGMATNAIEIGTVGPGPAMNFYLKDPSYHIISGAVNGGAVLVVRSDSDIQTVADLDGKRIAIPVIGGTQDIMLRKALQNVNLQTSDNGGTVEMISAAPADTTTLFVQKDVDGAAIPEPWAQVLESQVSGRTLLDWDEFAWGKESTSTVVVAHKELIESHPEYVEKYLQAHIKAVQFIQNEPVESQEIVVNHLKKLTGKEIDLDELAAAMENLTVTYEVNEEVIQEMATISKDAGYSNSDDLEGLIDFSFLEKVLK
ncbi:ABC transporter substrate-binding protein [Halalkalibacter nanhaiisediminis]|uniref:NitT/TauT family transport system substrate-binding protein n=1 Tax=Halalkalibacter nanhaiisediminis TaxID=688079 RepID=A0A562QR52_9BACI|nr:ABC transporter substrate-binding protein [Halalkalibacter nanhaiisediminis]TWI59231.1 NitT/TauT family transport system substrate-binding protein [Halalkalibacter nanhaiisediminis]